MSHYQAHITVQQDHFWPYSFDAAEEALVVARVNPPGTRITVIDLKGDKTHWIAGRFAGLASVTEDTGMTTVQDYCE